MSIKKIGVLLLTCCISAACFAGCAREEKYAGALKVGTMEIPKTLMPYVSTSSSNLFVAGNIYDTLLGTSNEEHRDNENYFEFEDNLISTESAYEKKEGSEYGWTLFTPTEEQLSEQLKKKKIEFGKDELGNSIEETEEEYQARSEEAVPKDNWMQYRFDVSEDFTWNDGEPFTAEDIEFTFKYIIKNTGSLASLAYFLDDYYDCYVEGNDLILILATNTISDIKPICNSIFILPSHIWMDVKKPAEEKNLNPVGTGPYIINEGDYIEDSTLTLTLREDAREADRTDIENISLIRLNSEEVMLNAMQAGDIDVSLDSIDYAKAHSLTENESYNNIKVNTGISSFVTTLALNNGENGIFRGNDQLRRAISLAIDQEELINQVFRGEGVQVSDGLVQPGLIHSLDKEHITNIDESNRILDELGYKADENGMRNLSLSVLALPHNEVLVNAISEQLKKSIGVTVSYEQAGSDYSEAIKQRNNPDFDMIINTVTFTIDKLLMFDARFGVYSDGSPRTFNYSGIVDEELSELMKKMDSESNFDKQVEYAKAVQEKLASLYAEIPLYTPYVYSVYNDSRFEGLETFSESSLKYIKHKGK